MCHVLHLTFAFLCTTQKMKFPVKDLFSKILICLHLFKKALLQNSTFCAVIVILKIITRSILQKTLTLTR